MSHAENEVLSSRREPAALSVRMAVLPVAVIMAVLPAAFFIFPITAAMETLHTPTGVVGAVLISLLCVCRLFVVRWLLFGCTPSRRLNMLVILEFVGRLAGFAWLGNNWVAVPVFGLVDVLLLLPPKVSVSLATVGTGAYILVVARVFGGELVPGLLAQFILCAVVLYLLPRFAITIRELDAARRRLTDQGVLEDRLRVARDLHDSLGQHLTAALFKLDLLKRDRVGGEMTEGAIRVSSIQYDLRSAMREVQRVVNGLRSATLAEQIEQSSALLRALGADVRVQCEAVEVSESVTETLGWILRELATNVVRHSVATWCVVDLRADGRMVILRVANNQPRRRSFGEKSGRGLIGVRERVASLGGEVKLGLHGGVHEVEISIPRRAV